MKKMDVRETHRWRSYDDPPSHKQDAGATHATIVRRTIEDEIFSGRLLPGASIDEEEIAKRFDISRTPVREAILALTQEGLVEKLPRRGCIVARLNVTRLIQLFEVAAELEALCASFAATRITDQEKRELTSIHEQAARALANESKTDYGRLAGRFHALIMLATHNAVLVEMTDKCARHLLPYRRFQVRLPNRSIQNQADHDRILEAIVANNGAAAAELMRKHVMVQGDVLAEFISAVSSSSP